MKIKIFTAICFFYLLISRSFCAQDDMAVGKFVPSESGFQVVKFHFSKSKTFIRFFEKLPDSPYLFPIFEILIKGQLIEKPAIEDVNNDKLDDIIFKTNAESGVIYFDKKLDNFIKTKREKIKRKVVTPKDELKLLDNT